MSNSTDALFRAWVQFIEDLIVTTGGWTNTTDTGQMTISTATHPGGSTTKVGYRVYHMADTLQSTSPVYMRIDYGSAGAANNPAFWVTIGTGSNGAGTITGIAFNGGASASPTVATGSSGTNACNSYGSASTNRVQGLLFVRSGANDLMIFSIERTKDSSGADTGDGILFAFSADGGTGLNRTQFVVLAGGGQPPTETGVTAALSNQSTSAFSSNVGIGIPIFFKGIAQQPGTGTIVLNSGDFLAEASVAMSLYGASVNFQTANSVTNQTTVPTGNGASSVRANSRVGIRYE
jgi:hypothetical protein